MKTTFLLATLASAALAFDGSGDISSEADLDKYLSSMSSGGTDPSSLSRKTKHGKGECVGGYVSDISLYADCKVITGFLALVDTKIADLDALVHLERIEAVANMPAPEGNGLLIKGNVNLENIDGLRNLNIVAGGISIDGNPVLRSTLGLGENLAHVGTNAAGETLMIKNNPQLADVGHSWDFFDGVAPGSLTLEENAVLANIRGLHTVQEVGGGVRVCGNPELTTLAGLERLTMVGKDAAGNGLTVCDNLQMQDTSAVKGMLNIAGSLSVTNNAAVQALTGFETIMNIGTNGDLNSIAIKNNGQLKTATITASSVTGSVEIENNPNLVLLDMSGLSTIGANAKGQSVVVLRNDNLKDLSGLRGLQGALTGAVTIASNLNLLSLDGLQKVLSAGRDNSGVSLAITDNRQLATTQGLAMTGKLEGAVHIMHNPSLKVLAGLQAISEVGADTQGVALKVYMNNVLENLVGFKGLTGDLAGAVQISGNAQLKDLDGFQSVTATTAATITDNPELISLHGLENVKTLDGSDPKGNSLTIKTNKRLADVNALQELAMVSGGIDIDANPSLKNVAALIKGLKSATKVSIHNVICFSTSDEALVKQAATGDVAVEKVTSVTACEGNGKTTLHVNKLDGAWGDKDNTEVGSLEDGHICGGTTSAASSVWKEWDAMGSNGLYMDVDTSKCNLKDAHPRYLTSVGGESAHWQLIGVNSVYDSTPTKFRLNLWHPTLRGRYLMYFAARYRWSINWLVDTSKRSGNTVGGATGWKRLAGTKNVIYADVNTEKCGYAHADGAAPRYVTAIHGGQNHWKAQGAHAVYKPTTRGFRTFLVYPDMISPATAEKNEWTVVWAGSYDDRVSGISSTNWLSYKDEALQIKVDTTAGLYSEKPSYVTSISGRSHHWMVTGAGSIYDATPQSFAIYIDRAKSVKFAAEHDWRVNYIAYATPTDCEVTNWGSWGACDKTCGGGRKVSTRTVSVPAYYGGTCNQKLSKTRGCNDDACPVDCELSAWSPFSKCTVSCGTGTKRRTRYVVRTPLYGGLVCEDLEEVTSCDEGSCPVHCDTSEWGSWSACPKTCGAPGSAQQYRTRSITQIAMHGGVVCPTLTSKRDCRIRGKPLQPCPVDCVQSALSTKSACSVTCGFGETTQTRDTLVTPKHGGKACLDSVVKYPCNAGACPVHCKTSGWSPVNPADATCSKSCGGGVRYQTRTVTQHAAHGGYECGNLVKETRCNRAACPRDCQVSAWGGWGICTKSCNTGTQTRTRKVSQNAAYGGVPCGAGGKALSQTRDCNHANCPVDCVLRPWGARDSEATNGDGWRTCSVTCGKGIQRRYRVVKTPATFGGKVCAHKEEQQQCEEGPCPIHCTTNRWQGWTTCSRSCGVGTQQRVRTIQTHADHGGYECGDLKQTRQCATFDCPVDCVAPSFSEADWMPCTRDGEQVTCGGGVQTRSRKISRVAAFGGKLCGALWQERKCNTHACPINCVTATVWHDVGTCSKSCKASDGVAGKKKQELEILVPPAHGGAGCGTTAREVNCNEFACPIDCEFTKWTEWGKPDGSLAAQGCSLDCGGGRTTRTREITRAHAHGGVECPTELMQTKSCNWHPCPIDCKPGDWTVSNADWAAGRGFTCSKSCQDAGGDPGRGFRSRSVLRYPKWGGKACGVLEQSQPCNQHACPIDCIASPWSPWSSCSKTCGHSKDDRGTMTSTRKILQNAAHGGKGCGKLTREKKGGCFVTRCPVHCVVGSWGSWGSCTKTCGTGGTRTKRRKIITHDDHGGFVCPETAETEPCKKGLNGFVGPCPINCLVSQWGSWHAYNGGGKKVQRLRTVTREAKFGGKVGQCNNLRQERTWTHKFACTEKEEYGKWSGCTKDCGTGYRYRYKEHVMCSKKAVVRMHYMFRQGEHCNVKTCPTSAAAAVVHDIKIPKIASSMFLDEQLAGDWKSVDADEMGLPTGHWQKLV